MSDQSQKVLEEIRRTKSNLLKQGAAAALGINFSPVVGPPVNQFGGVSVKFLLSTTTGLFLKVNNFLGSLCFAAAGQSSYYWIQRGAHVTGAADSYAITSTSKRFKFWIFCISRIPFWKFDITRPS